MGDYKHFCLDKIRCSPACTERLKKPESSVAGSHPLSVDGIQTAVPAIEKNNKASQDVGETCAFFSYT
jgi:hypothetical protein